MTTAATNREPVLVAGWAGTGPVALDRRSIPEMVLEAVEGALESAAVGYDDIDAVVTASVDLFDGLTASNIAVTEVVGAVMKPETRISADGLCAAIHGAMQIWAGAYDVVLIAAHAKPSMSAYDDLTAWALDPIHSQAIGLDFKTCAGLQASAVARGNNQAEKNWARIAAARRASVANGFQPALEVEEILDSPVIASPLRKEMCAPYADGACAVVLCRGDPATASRRKVRMSGVGYDLAPPFLGDRDLTTWDGLARSCGRAYAMADIVDPASQLDLAEPSCAYPHEEELFRSASGIGDTAIISPGGGLHAGYVPVVAGLSRLAAAAEFMERNSDCHYALAHGTWGPVGQGQAVAVLRDGVS